MYKIASPLPPSTCSINSIPSSRLFFSTAILHQVGNDQDPGVRVTDKNLDYQNFKRTDFTSLPAKVPRQTRVYVEGSELNHTNRTSIRERRTMDQQSKDKSQPGYPATSTNILSAQAHPGDSTALANSNKAGESVQTQRWLEEEARQGPWNVPARVISEETKSGKLASKGN